jgi:DNA-binding response OmpR family regulator
MSTAVMLQPAGPATMPAEAEAVAVVRTALVVDGVAGLLGTITAHLAGLLDGVRYHVLTARDFREAIAHLVVARPDVLAVDLDLPRDGGYAVCEYVRAVPAHARVPIVMTAAFDVRPGRVWAKGVGPCTFLRKPYSMLQLTRVLEAAVRERGPARA